MLSHPPLHPTKVERDSGAAANVTGVPSSYIAVQSLLTAPAVIEQLMPTGSLNNVPLPPPPPCTANSCCGTVTPPQPTVKQVINMRAWGRVTGRLAEVVVVMEGERWRAVWEIVKRGGDEDEPATVCYVVGDLSAEVGGLAAILARRTVGMVRLLVHEPAESE